jgi:hypothetical protein
VVDRGFIVQVLWQPFLDQIRTGGPVFFSFSSELLVEIFDRNRIPYDGNVVGLICEMAAELFEVVNDDAVLLPVALAPGPSGRSSAILLVCQQVLAVEEMVREPSGYSENAYFPRLRKLMSAKLQPLSLNPFSFPDFESIWRTLATEVRAVPGASEASITFRFGVESGINKARSFPLSQGLLSLEDLRVIVANVGQKRLSTMLPAEMWRTLRRTRSRLGRRGQRLIGLGIFKDRVIDQVRGYALRASVGPPKSELERPKSIVDVVLYKDAVDWLTTEYRAYLLEVETRRRIFDENKIAAEFVERSANREPLLFTLDELGDSWSCSNRASVIGAGQTFLVVGSPQAIEGKLSELEAAGLAGLSYSKVFSELDAAAGLFVADVTVPEGAETEVSVRNGKVVASGRIAGAFRWLGGVALDARRQKFLREALPIGIAFGEVTLKLQELETVDGHRVGYGALQQSLASALDDFSVEIGFPGGHKARLAFAVSRANREGRIGFFVEEDESIAAVADLVSDVDFAIVGCNEIRREVIGLSLENCMRLLKALKKDVGIRPSDSEIERISRRVQSSKAPYAVRKVIQSLLKMQKCVPADLLQAER